MFFSDSHLGSRILFLACSLALSACGGDDDALMDAGADVDIVEDGAMNDAGDEDAGEVDASEPDAMIECEPGAIVPPRGEHALAYDAAHNRLLMHGGNIVAPMECRPAYEYTDELWAFDLTCKTWSAVETTGEGPGTIGRHNLIIDAERGRALTFGGRRTLASGQHLTFEQVWSLDLETFAWTELSTSGEGPSGRYNSSAVLDAENGRVIVFGGNDAQGLSSSPLGDMFALDLASGAWTELNTADGPTARYYHGVATHGRSMYVFAGQPSYFGPYFNDVWEFNMDSNTWTAHPASSPIRPGTRFGAGVFATDGAIYAFAGHDETDLGNSNDVWRFDLSTNTWTRAVFGDELNGSAIGPCMFPPDFTIPDTEAPERRHGFGIAQGEGRGYIAFGKTDCGNINDVWSLELESGTWSLEGMAATAGEACNRSGIETCSNLCN